MTARAIALALGGRRAERLADGSYLVACPVRSHGKGRGDRSPSLSIADGERRLLVRCFAGCDALDVLAELRRRGLLDDNGAPRHERRIGNRSAQRDARASRRDNDDDHYARQQAHKAAWLWSQRRPLAGTIAGRYLRVRGYDGALPSTLGFLPPSKPDHHPALIAAFALVGEIEPGVLAEPRDVNAVHLTLLRADGSAKAEIEHPKLCVASPAGRPITLAPPNDLLGIAITEGIEDALSVHVATGLGAWAAGSATFLPALVRAVPSYTEAITIFGHDDKSGRAGALSLAERLHTRGTIDVFLEGLPRDQSQSRYQ
jgi:hypothetical protein